MDEKKQTVTECLDVISARKSIRAFRRDETPSRHTIRRIMNTGASAPWVSHDDEPPVRFIATDDPGLIKSIANSIDPEDPGDPDHLPPDAEGFNPLTYFKNAPWVIVVLSKIPDPEAAPDERQDSINYDMTVSTGAAIGAILSAVQLAGLAASWIGSFTASAGRRVDGTERLLGVKSPWRVHSIIPVGYAAEAGRVLTYDRESVTEFR